MIKSFRHKGSETFYRSRSTKGIQSAHHAKLARVLAALDAAAAPGELNHPGYNLHPLKGELKGHWSVWINGNWRVTFRFIKGDAELVDYLDHH
jgi:proteic killer suppression protein